MSDGKLTVFSTGGDVIAIGPASVQIRASGTEVKVYTTASLRVERAGVVDSDALLEWGEDVLTPVHIFDACDTRVDVGDVLHIDSNIT